MTDSSVSLERMQRKHFPSPWEPHRAQCSPVLGMFEKVRFPGSIVLTVNTWETTRWVWNLSAALRYARVYQTPSTYQNNFYTTCLNDLFNIFFSLHCRQNKLEFRIFCETHSYLIQNYIFILFISLIWSKCAGSKLHQPYHTVKWSWKMYGQMLSWASRPNASGERERDSTVGSGPVNQSMWEQWNSLLGENRTKWRESRCQ